MSKDSIGPFEKLSSEEEEDLHELYYGGHNYGRDKLFWVFQEKYPSGDVSRRAIADWLSRQQIHQQYTRPTMTRGVVRPMVTKEIGYIQLDCLNFQSSAFNGFDCVVNAVDVFSRYYWAYPCKGQTGVNVVKALNNFVANGMKISFISFDNGTEFLNEDVKKWLDDNMIKWRTAKPHTPWSSGSIESSGGVFKKSLFMLMKTKGTKNWVDLLPQVVKNLNSTMKFATKRAPIDLQYSEDNREEAAHRNVAQANRRYKQKAGTRKSGDLVIGDTVRLRIDYDSSNLKKASKLGYWRDEVYEIVNVIQNRKYANLTSNYRIKDKENGEVMKGIYARGMLMKINPDFVPIPKAVVNPGPVEAEGFDVYEVESILDKQKGRNGKVLYKVAWKGYKVKTWEPAANLKGAKELIKEFNKAHK